MTHRFSYILGLPALIDTLFVNALAACFKLLAIRGGKFREKQQ